MELHDAAREGKAYAGALFFCAIEGEENLFRVGGRDEGAVVADDDADAVRRCRGVKADAAVRLPVDGLHGVTDDVEQRQMDEFGISMDDGFAANDIVNAVGQRLTAERQTQVVEERSHRSMRQLWLGQVGQFVVGAEEVAYALSLLVDDMDGITGVLSGHLVLAHPVGKRDDGRDGVAELMRHDAEDAVVVLPLRLYGKAVGAIVAEYAVHVVHYGAEQRVVRMGEVHGGIAALHGSHVECHLSEGCSHDTPEPCRHHRPQYDERRTDGHPPAVIEGSGHAAEAYRCACRGECHDGDRDDQVAREVSAI